ncbi:hypothetical protein Daus18300_007192 [Diaporthe australafricana]|uniref:Uncharacterized protein n=1 Tax=Diaporthe australafricana TaxID=127596 RepID=A0ABR3WPD6_9PEZI
MEPLTPSAHQVINRNKPGSFSRPPGEEAAFPTPKGSSGAADDSSQGERKKKKWGRKPGWYQANIITTGITGMNPYDRSLDPDRPTHHYGGGCGHDGPRTSCPVHGDNCCWGGNEDARQN